MKLNYKVIEYNPGGGTYKYQESSITAVNQFKLIMTRSTKVVAECRTCMRISAALTFQAVQGPSLLPEDGNIKQD